MSKPDVIVIGAGISGLTCAAKLHDAGISVKVLEAGSEVGGRVRTQEVDGFLLDRGFQIFLTSYPEARRLLDYDALDFQYFDHGAMIFDGSDFHILRDPLVHPQHLLRTFSTPPGTLLDRLRMIRTRLELAFRSPEALSETSTEVALRKRWGFSDDMIEKFFRPFIGGILLDRSLSTSSKSFDFVFSMFSTGRAVLPSRGMQRIPEQLGSGLPPESLKLNTRVEAVRPKAVKLDLGTWLEAEIAVVLAADEQSASRLLEEDTLPQGNPNHTVYFAAPRPPYDEPLLALNGSGEGLVNTVSVQTNVARGYAPLGLALVSVSIVDEIPESATSLPERIRRELSHWFGREVEGWEHLHTDALSYALPSQLPPTEHPGMKIGKHGILQCGDYLSTPSINGAMASGREVARFITEEHGG